MKSTVLPDLDSETIERLKQRFPDLTNVELPKMETIGKTAEQTIDRLMGRKRASIWPWVAAGVLLLTAVGTIAAYFTWFKRPALDSIETLDIESVDVTSSVDTFAGTESYGSNGSTVDRAWPTETATNVMVGTEEV